MAVYLEVSRFTWPPDLGESLCPFRTLETLVQPIGCRLWHPPNGLEAVTNEATGSRATDQARLSETSEPHSENLPIARRRTNRFNEEGCLQSRNLVADRDLSHHNQQTGPNTYYNLIIPVRATRPQNTPPPMMNSRSSSRLAHCMILFAPCVKAAREVLGPATQ